MQDQSKTKAQLIQEIQQLRKKNEELLTQHDQKLAALEARWRSLFDLLPVGVSVVEAPLSIAVSNPMLSEILEMSQGALQHGEHLRRQYFHPDLTPMSLEEFPSMRAFREQKIVRDVEIGIEKEDGSLIWISVSAAPLPDNTGAVIVTVDITSRKQTEDTLRKKEAILSSILNATRESIWLFSLDGIILLGNETALARLRRPAEEVIGRPFSQLVPPELVQARQQCLDDVARTAAPVELVDERAGYIFRHTFYPVMDGEHVSQVVAFSRDITERRRSEEEIRQMYARVTNEKNHLSAVLQVLPVGVAILDEQGGAIQANLAYEQLWGLGRPEIKDIASYDLYKAWWVDTGKRVDPHEWASALAVEKGETVIGQLLEIERFDGTHRFVLNSGAPVYDDLGKIVGCAVAIMDVTLLKQAQADLMDAREALRQINLELQKALTREQTFARTDNLTGVHNRRYFFEAAHREFAQAERYRMPLALIIFDIDHFKKVNDDFGHQMGDQILQEVAQITRQALRGVDILARYGGEEFVILLPNSTAKEAVYLAERIREQISLFKLKIGSNQVGVTISLGVVDYPGSGQTLESLIQQADKALYAAKNAGRNCVRTFLEDCT